MQGESRSGLPASSNKECAISGAFRFDFYFADY